MSTSTAPAKLTTPGKTAVVDAADEASGGEVVFASDGLNPPAPRPPPIRQSQQASSTDGDGVDYTNVSAQQAFETFAGKLYYPTERVTTTSSAANTTNNRSMNAGETPLERLQRLHAEVTELESDLSLSQSGGQSQSDESNNQALLSSISEIKSRLAATTLSSTPSIQQEALTQTVSSSLNALRGGGETAAAAAAPPSSSSSTDTAILARLQKLESVMGNSSSSSSSATANASLMQRLTTLERSMARLDEKELEALTKKAKVIRQDLEAASKARNKLMSVTGGSAGGGGGSGGGGATTSSSSSSSSNIRAEDSKTITDLHDEWIQLQGMTQHLPALSQRLQVLAQEHAAAATYGARLQACEKLACQELPPQVALLEGALTKMEQNLQASADQMLTNVKALQDRVDKL